MEAERNITLKTIKLSGFKCTGHKQEEVTIFWKEFFILKDWKRDNIYISIHEWKHPQFSLIPDLFLIFKKALY